MQIKALALTICWLIFQNHSLYLDLHISENGAKNTTRMCKDEAQIVLFGLTENDEDEQEQQTNSHYKLSNTVFRYTQKFVPPSRNQIGLYATIQVRVC